MPFGPPGTTVVVGEGWESTLAEMRLRSVPFGIAAMSASNIPNLALPPSIKKVFIAQDNDYAGREASAKALLAWTALGIDVVVDVYGLKDSGFDAADELMARAG